MLTIGLLLLSASAQSPQDLTPVVDFELAWVGQAGWEDGQLPNDMIIKDGPWEGIEDDRLVNGIADAPDTSTLLELEARYRERVAQVYGLEPQDDTVYRVPRGFIDPLDESSAQDTGYGAEPLMCYNDIDYPPEGVEPDGDGGSGASACCGSPSEYIYGSDDRVRVTNPVLYPNTKFPLYGLVSLQEDNEDYAALCSGAFLDEKTVLTAAHCLYNTVTNQFKYTSETAAATEYGTDYSRGYVCIKNGKTGGGTSWDFADECEFVHTRYIPSNYINETDPRSSGALKYDFAILKIESVNFPSGLGAGSWIAMSSIDEPSILDNKTPVSHGYPYEESDGTFNRYYSYFGQFSLEGELVDGYGIGSRQLRNTDGKVKTSTTSSLLKTNLDAGQGQSGSAIFYYTDDSYEYSGQAHYVIGLLAGEGSPLIGSWIGGPTVGQFRSFALTHMEQ